MNNLVFDEFVKENRAFAQKSVNKVTDDYEVREDLLQEVWLEVWRCWDKYDTALPPGPWVTVIANRVCFNHLRDLSTTPELILDSSLAIDSPTDDEDATEGSYIEETIESPYDDPEELVALDELSVNLETLSSQEKEVFQAVYIEGRPYSEVGEHVFRAIDRIREKAGVKKAYKSPGKLMSGAVYNDWSWKPNGIGNERMGPTPAIQRLDLVEMENNNNDSANSYGNHQSS